MIKISREVDIANIDYAFESANLLNVTQSGYNKIGFSLNRSQPYPCWFYFSILKGALNQEIEFICENWRDQSICCGYDKSKAVYSYDGGQTWNRFSNTVPKWQHKFTQDSVLIAWTFPYLYSKLQSYLDTQDSLGKDYYNRLTFNEKSVEGRNLELITITNFSIPESEKKVIWLITGQHPEETNSMWQLRYMMEFLLNETNEIAIKYRNKYIWKIFPMMNPDGIYHGFSRYNANLKDLNREWDNEEGNYEPEVNAAFGYIKSWMNAGKSMDLFIDMHGIGGYSVWTMPLEKVGQQVYNNIQTLASYYKTMTFYSSSADNYIAGRSVDKIIKDHKVTGLTSENRPQDPSVTLEILKDQGIKTLSVFDVYLSNLK